MAGQSELVEHFFDQSVVHRPPVPLAGYFPHVAAVPHLLQQQRASSGCAEVNETTSEATRVVILIVLLIVRVAIVPVVQSCKATRTLGTPGVFNFFNVKKIKLFHF